MTQLCAVVIEDPFTDGRFLVCRRQPSGWDTAVSSHCDRVSADRECRKLQAQYDQAASAEPQRKGQLALGFYGPEFGDA